MRLFFFILSLSIGIFSHAQNKQALIKSDSLFAKGVELYNQGNYKAAIPLFTESDKIDKAELDSTSNRRDYSAMWLGSCYYKLGDEERAKEVSTFEYMYPPVDRRMTVKSDSLAKIGANYIHVNNIEQALKYYAQTEVIEKKMLGTNNLWYANTLKQTAEILMAMDDSIQALEYAKKCHEIHKRITPLPTYYKLNVLSILAGIYDYYEFQEHNSISLSYYKEALQMGKELKTNIENMQFLTYCKAKVLRETANETNDNAMKAKILQEALRTLTEIKFNDEITELKEKITYEYDSTLKSLRNEQPAMNAYNKAANLIMDGKLIEALNYLEFAWEKNIGINIDYQLKGETYNILQKMKMNNPKMQEKYDTDFLTILKKEKQDIRSLQDSTIYLSNLEAYACNGVLTKEKIGIALEASRLDKVLNKDTTNYSQTKIKILEFIAMGDEAIGKWKSAMYCYNRILKHHPERSLGLKSFGMCRYALGYVWSAINLKLFNDTTLYNVAHSVATSILDKEKTHQSDLTREAVKAWALLTPLHSSKDIITSSTILLGVIKSQFMNRFEYFTGWERDSFQKQHGDLIEMINSNMLKLKSISNRDKAILMTNNIFFSGMLLRNESNLRSFISTSSNEQLKEKIQKWEKLQKEVTFSRSKKECNEIIEVEEQIMKQAKKIGYKPFEDSFYLDIFLNKMTQEDVLIQFGIAYNYLIDDSPIYMAYIMHKNGDIDMVPLFKENEFMQYKIGSQNIKTLLNQNKYSDLLYSSPIVGKIIWGKLLPFCLNAQRIYFSPIGLLYSIGIENLLIDNDKRISDIHQVYRLSSLKSFCESSHKNKNSYAASVFGGLVYDFSQRKSVNTHIEDTKQDEQNRKLAENITRSNIYPTYLPGTKKEVEDISYILNKGKYKTRLFVDEKGTEEAFKLLSGKRDKLIHIATHGYYIPQKNKTYSPLDSLLMQGDYIDPNQSISRRSGLFLSGCNSSLNGAIHNNQIEDGILTSDEIAQMDLKGTDLVVLSACQTGLGEITGDGVFGLQRGFKKAGANTLLMSLWKVDDTATQLLMTQFYKNLLAGKSKFESLRDAQKYVRDYEVEIEITTGKRWKSEARQKEEKNKEATPKEIRKIKKYKDPFYWAAFILLDAMD